MEEIFSQLNPYNFRIGNNNHVLRRPCLWWEGTHRIPTEENVTPKNGLTDKSGRPSQKG